ncbi:hypothetical protein ACQJBY_006213 [Aegilops geniculata]
MEEDAAAAAAAAPDSWETADLDGAMSRLLLSSSTTSPSASPAARRVSSSPDLADDGQDTDAQQEQDPARGDDPVAQVDQFLREALEKPREHLQGRTGGTATSDGMKPGHGNPPHCTLPLALFLG